MSDQDSTIFSGSTDQVPPAVSQTVSVDNPPTATTEYTDLLTQIKAEDGRQKYNSVPDALKGLHHSQTHIKTLEQELAKLKEEVTKHKGVEEILDKITNTNKESVTQTPPQLDVNTVSSLVEQALEKQNQKTTVLRNTTTVVSAMQDNFGDKAEEIFIRVAQENGLTVAQLNTLASVSPAAVLKLVGINGSKQPATPTKPNNVINTQALPNTNQPTPNIKIPVGARTKDLVAGWKAAGVAIKSN